jgi:hypothetical protein
VAASSLLAMILDIAIAASAAATAASLDTLSWMICAWATFHRRSCSLSFSWHLRSWS